MADFGVGQNNREPFGAASAAAAGAPGTGFAFGGAGGAALAFSFSSANAGASKGRAGGKSKGKKKGGKSKSKGKSAVASGSASDAGSDASSVAPSQPQVFGGGAPFGGSGFGGASTGAAPPPFGAGYTQPAHSGGGGGASAPFAFDAPANAARGPPRPQPDGMKPGPGNQVKTAQPAFGAGPGFMPSKAAAPAPPKPSGGAFAGGSGGQATGHAPAFAAGAGGAGRGKPFARSDVPPGPPSTLPPAGAGIAGASRTLFGALDAAAKPSAAGAFGSGAPAFGGGDAFAPQPAAAAWRAAPFGSQSQPAPAKNVARNLFAADPGPPPQLMPRGKPLGLSGAVSGGGSPANMPSNFRSPEAAAKHEAEYERCKATQTAQAGGAGDLAAQNAAAAAMDLPDDSTDEDDGEQQQKPSPTHTRFDDGDGAGSAGNADSAAINAASSTLLGANGTAAHLSPEIGKEPLEPINRQHSQDSSEIGAFTDTADGGAAGGSAGARPSNAGSKIGLQLPTPVAEGAPLNFGAPAANVFGAPAAAAAGGGAAATSFSFAGTGGAAAGKGAFGSTLQFGAKKPGDAAPVAFPAAGDAGAAVGAAPTPAVSFAKLGAPAATPALFAPAAAAKAPALGMFGAMPAFGAPGVFPPATGAKVAIPAAAGSPAPKAGLFAVPPVAAAPAAATPKEGLGAETLMERLQKVYKDPRRTTMGAKTRANAQDVGFLTKLCKKYAANPDELFAKLEAKYPQAAENAAPIACRAASAFAPKAAAPAKLAIMSSHPVSDIDDDNYEQEHKEQLAIYAAYRKLYRRRIPKATMRYIELNWPKLKRQLGLSETEWKLKAPDGKKQQLEKLEQLRTMGHSPSAKFGGGGSAAGGGSVGGGTGGAGQRRSAAQRTPSLACASHFGSGKSLQLHFKQALRSSIFISEDGADDQETEFGAWAAGAVWPTERQPIDSMALCPLPMNTGVSKPPPRAAIYGRDGWCVLDLQRSGGGGGGGAVAPRVCASHLLGDSESVLHAAWHPLSTCHLVVLSQREEHSQLRGNAVIATLDVFNVDRPQPLREQSVALDGEGWASFAFVRADERSRNEPAVGAGVGVDLFTALLLKRSGELHAVGPLVPADCEIDSSHFVRLCQQTEAAVRDSDAEYLEERDHWLASIMSPGHFDLVLDRAGSSQSIEYMQLRTVRTRKRAEGSWAGYSPRPFRVMDYNIGGSSSAASQGSSERRATDLLWRAGLGASSVSTVFQNGELEFLLSTEAALPISFPGSDHRLRDQLACRYTVVCELESNASDQYRFAASSNEQQLAYSGSGHLVLSVPSFAQVRSHIALIVAKELGPNAENAAEEMALQEAFSVRLEEKDKSRASCVGCCELRSREIGMFFAKRAPQAVTTADAPSVMKDTKDGKSSKSIRLKRGFYPSLKGEEIGEPADLKLHSFKDQKAEIEKLIKALSSECTLDQSVRTGDAKKMFLMDDSGKVGGEPMQLFVKELGERLEGITDTAGCMCIKCVGGKKAGCKEQVCQKIMFSKAGDGRSGKSVEHELTGMTAKAKKYKEEIVGEKQKQAQVLARIRALKERAAKLQAKESEELVSARCAEVEGALGHLQDMLDGKKTAGGAASHGGGGGGANSSGRGGSLRKIRREANKAKNEAQFTTLGGSAGGSVPSTPAGGGAFAATPSTIGGATATPGTAFQQPDFEIGTPATGGSSRSMSFAGFYSTAAERAAAPASVGRSPAHSPSKATLAATMSSSRSPSVGANMASFSDASAIHNSASRAGAAAGIAAAGITGLTPDEQDAFEDKLLEQQAKIRGLAEELRDYEIETTNTLHF